MMRQSKVDNGAEFFSHHGAHRTTHIRKITDCQGHGYVVKHPAVTND